MKNFLALLIACFLYINSFGQEAGKIGDTDVDNISKIGSVPISATGGIGNIAVEVYLPNCQAIKENNPAAEDGIYTIDPDGSGTIEPFDCYCDMTTDGGGWTMVGYYRHPTTENAPIDLDNRDYAYFMKARNDLAYGKPEYIANPDSEGAWTDWRVLSSVTWPIEFAIILDQPTWSSGWEEYYPMAIYRVKNRNIMPNYGTDQDLSTADNLYYKLLCTNSWADVGSSSASGTYFWFPRNGGNEYLGTFHVSNYYYLDGREPTNYHNGVYKGSGLVSGDNTWHHSARMFIR